MRTNGRCLRLVADAALAFAAALAYAHGTTQNLHMEVAAATAADLYRPARQATGQHSQVRTTAAYDSIAIAQPAKDATVFNNEANVRATVDVSPELRGGAGDRIALVLDARRTSAQVTTRFELSDLARGEHTLEAQVVDSTDAAVIS